MGDNRTWDDCVCDGDGGEHPFVVDYGDAQQVGYDRTMEWVKQYGVLILAGAVGIGVLGYGLWGEIMPEQAKVEIIKSQIPNSQILKSGEREQIVVDIAGAVEKPGLYKLPGGSRIGDGLVMAGGLSGQADREWVAKTINLAEVVKDGGKIYIPVYKETPSQSNGKGVSLGEQGTVNINTASLGELDTLTGIGEARAQTIIASRPYGSLEELVSKAKIPQSVYDKIKDNISIY